MECSFSRDSRLELYNSDLEALQRIFKGKKTNLSLPKNLLMHDVFDMFIFALLIDSQALLTEEEKLKWISRFKKVDQKEELRPSEILKAKNPTPFKIESSLLPEVKKCYQVMLEKLATTLEEKRAPAALEERRQQIARLGRRFTVESNVTCPELVRQAVQEKLCRSQKFSPRDKMKMFGHKYNLHVKLPDGDKTTGYYVLPAVEQFNHGLKKFIQSSDVPSQQDQKNLQKISEAFNKAEKRLRRIDLTESPSKDEIRKKTFKAMVEEWKEGELIVLPIGWDTHAVFAAMIKVGDENYLAYVNLGYSSLEAGAHFYAMKRELTTEMLESIYPEQERPSKEGIKFFEGIKSGSLSALLKLTFIGRLPMEGQKVGNCTVESLYGGVDACRVLTNPTLLNQLREEGGISHLDKAELNRFHALFRWMDCKRELANSLENQKTSAKPIPDSSYFRLISGVLYQLMDQKRQENTSVIAAERDAIIEMIEDHLSSHPYTLQNCIGDYEASYSDNFMENFKTGAFYIRRHSEKMDHLSLSVVDGEGETKRYEIKVAQRFREAPIYILADGTRVSSLNELIQVFREQFAIELKYPVYPDTQLKSSDKLKQDSNRPMYVMPIAANQSPGEVLSNMTSYLSGQLRKKKVGSYLYQNVDDLYFVGIRSEKSPLVITIKKENDQFYWVQDDKLVLLNGNSIEEAARMMRNLIVYDIATAYYYPEVDKNKLNKSFKTIPFGKVILRDCQSIKGHGDVKYYTAITKDRNEQGKDLPLRTVYARKGESWYAVKKEEDGNWVIDESRCLGEDGPFFQLANVMC